MTGHDRRQRRNRSQPLVPEREAVVPDDAQAESSTTDTVSVVVPEEQARPVSPPVVLRTVKLRNRSGQDLNCSVLSEDGSLRTVRIPARGVSESIIESNLTEHALAMVARGHLSIVQ